MPRPEKVAAVAEIKERIEGAKAVFLAEYAGLSVKQQQDLRRGLREQGAEFKVVKMTLARRAASDLELDEIDDLLLGPTGIAFADADAVSAAKVLKEFSSAHEVFTVKGGLLGTDFLTPERISELAEIAPRPELLAMLAGAMKAPLTAMAGLLAALPRSAATVMQQLLEKKESGEFVSGVVAADEAPPEDTADAASAASEPSGEDETAEDAAAEGSADEATADDAGETGEGDAAESDAAEAGEVEAAAEVADEEPQAAEDDEEPAADTADENTAEVEASADDSTEESEDDDAAEPAEED